MKKVLSYVLTAAVASALTLAVVIRLTPNQITKLEQLEALIQQRFIGQWDAKAMEDGAAKGMISALGDRWTYYIPADEYAAYEEQMENAYVGVGITIAKQEEDGYIQIVSVIPGASAQEAGMQVGDWITAIEGQSTRDMTPTGAKNIVRGEEGTNVVFELLRGEEALTLSVTRRQIQTPVATSELLEGHIGLITIHNFDTRCAEESIAAIEALREQGAAELIFDVRGNPGGYAYELVELLDYLLPEGDLFRSVDYQGCESVDTSDAAFLDMPMAVLCDGNSYSAAEFFAAAIQEYGAGTIVGTPTCGKGYFQNTFRLVDGSAVALSVGKYFTPKGNSLIGVGIQPDLLVEVDEETVSALHYGTLAHEDDPQLQSALDLFRR